MLMVGVCLLQVNRPLTMKKDGIQTRNRKTSVKSKRHKKNYALPPSAVHHRHQHLSVAGQAPLDLPPGYDRPAHYLFAGSTGALGPSPAAGLGSQTGGRSPYVHHAGGGGGSADGLATPFMAAAFGHDGYGTPAERFGPVAAAAAVHLAGLNCMTGSTRQGMIGAVA